MYCVCIEPAAKPGQEQAIVELFREYVPVVTSLPGCIRFELNQSASDPQSFLLYELYENREALLAHRGDELFKIWRPRIAALEQSRQLREFECVVSGSHEQLEELPN